MLELWISNHLMRDFPHKISNNTIQTNLVRYNEMDSEQARLFTTFFVTQKVIAELDHKSRLNEPESHQSQKPLPKRQVSVERDFHYDGEEFILTNFLRHEIEKSQIITSEAENLQSNDTMFDTVH